MTKSISNLFKLFKNLSSNRKKMLPLKEKNQFPIYFPCVTRLRKTKKKKKK